jgi:hypothetical protein
MANPQELAPVVSRIAHAIEADQERPWCVHRIYEEVLKPWKTTGGRDNMLSLAREAIDELVRRGAVRSEPISAISIGAHCDDLLIWSPHSSAKHLSDFGPDYEVPRVLQRLVSHLECQGL